MVMVMQPFHCVKTHPIIPLKGVGFIVCKLYLNKPDFKLKKELFFKGTQELIFQKKDEESFWGSGHSRTGILDSRNRAGDFGAILRAWGVIKGSRVSE